MFTLSETSHKFFGWLCCLPWYDSPYITKLGSTFLKFILFFFIYNSSNQCHGTAQIRLLLFRECEVRGRRLIFDSGGGSGPRQFKDEFQELQLMTDMVFGSATLKYSGDNFRVHDFISAPWKSNFNNKLYYYCIINEFLCYPTGYEMMLSKVFIIPPLSQQGQIRTDNRHGIALWRGIHVCLLKIPFTRVFRNRNSSGTTAAEKLASAPSDSGYVEWAEERDGCWGSGISSTTSGASSRTSFGSVSLIIPRIASSARKAASDSILENGNPISSNGQQQNRSRKTRLAMALLFSPTDQLKEM